MMEEAFVRVPLATFKSLVAMASSHLEDLLSGIEDGTYKASENQDVGEKVAAMAIAAKAVSEALI